MEFDDDTLIAQNYLRQFKKKVIKNYSSKTIIKAYYRSMLQRVKSGTYKKKGIKVEISYDEFEKLWMNNLETIQKIQDAGYVPSVDRINSMGNYVESNLRFIPLDLNRALGKIEQLQNQLKRLYKFVEKFNGFI